MYRSHLKAVYESGLLNDTPSSSPSPLACGDVDELGVSVKCSDTTGQYTQVFFTCYTAYPDKISGITIQIAILVNKN